MNKQQSPLTFGKPLSSKAMKQLQGGIITTGLWVCTADYYDCYQYKSQCTAACSRPTSCRNYAYCP